ncbi:hypothetical protein [Geoalkalibacter halelectricus]|uniref:Uncharacterized protein n=1 Tax=Geoalkalibacter halelectricus TaxID=2847045 RepID=A0ABY5ZP09_9BACT|nr:hypothetical protein [Geoalkalibacter halelectricus]MDO3376863.1 hypothetical protein [Geoalkalibacter halelectricus]UWZ79615.1 hypothetical protein L9S41_18325 [Geoalkalibacter halelectricus]
MNVRKAYGILLAGLFFLLLPLTQALSAETIRLQAGKDAIGARGEVVVTDLGSGQKEVVITAVGLRTDAVYTVWLVNEKPRMEMAGLGEADYAFTSDGQGAGHYTAALSAEELGKWQLIKIAYHPDRNPRNMGNITVDLEGSLK